MATYLALLRGVNVGGHGLVKMSELQTALNETKQLQDVQTYIQSGNVIFSSELNDDEALATVITGVILQKFKLSVDVAIFSKSEWQAIIAVAPAWWGNDSTRKHNLLIMIKPASATEAIKAIGELKPGIEAIQIGEGVVYQSLSLELFGRTSGGKLASNPIYKKMTIRNFNTATKLLTLLEQR